MRKILFPVAALLIAAITFLAVGPAKTDAQTTCVFYLSGLNNNDWQVQSPNTVLYYEWLDGCSTGSANTCYGYSVLLFIWKWVGFNWVKLDQFWCTDFNPSCGQYPPGVQQTIFLDTQDPEYGLESGSFYMARLYFYREICTKVNALMTPTYWSNIVTWTQE